MGDDDFVLNKTDILDFLIGLLLSGMRYHCQLVMLKVFVALRRE